MAERPIILFPSPEKADRNAKNVVVRRYNMPHFPQQYNRLQPSFNVLQESFRQKNIKIQQSTIGLNPDFALVFEIVGSVDSFYTAVKNSDGLEWIFDLDTDKIEPDDDFYEIKNGVCSDVSMSGKLYCVMSNQQALSQIISLWKRYMTGEEDVFKRGFAGLREIFTHIKNIRKWDASDRFAETGVIDTWREQLEFNGDNPTPFEIELFYRNDNSKQNIASQTVRQAVYDLGGNIMPECVIPEISYHGLLACLPRNVIEGLVTDYDSIELSHIDDIMFFRPGSQSANISLMDTESFGGYALEQTAPEGNVIAAVLDGMPLQNHALLQGRIILDDPDEYGQNYMAKHRIHGTAMASLVIYGDLSKNEEPIKHPIYVRPIFKPKEIGKDKIEEAIPENILFVDVLHRAIKRIKEGEQGNNAVAPDVQIINLSMGDRVRQLGNTMSPIARMIDYLAYKYKLLFIISAGNHPEILDDISASFRDLKARSLTRRNCIF